MKIRKKPWWIERGYANTKEVGHYFSLCEVKRAYKLGSKNVRYEEKHHYNFFEDFDKWWDGLSEMKRAEILNHFL